MIKSKIYIQISYFLAISLIPIKNTSIYIYFTFLLLGDNELLDIPIRLHHHSTSILHVIIIIVFVIATCCGVLSHISGPKCLLSVKNMQRSTF